jgi:hypothetical protein
MSISPALFEILGPMYKLWGELTGKGDFMTVWAKKDERLSPI